MARCRRLMDPWCKWIFVSNDFITSICICYIQLGFCDFRHHHQCECLLSESFQEGLIFCCTHYQCIWNKTDTIDLRLNISVNFTGRMLYNTLMLIHIHRETNLFLNYHECHESLKCNHGKTGFPIFIWAIVRRKIVAEYQLSFNEFDNRV